jgi:hypothetical protein
VSAVKEVANENSGVRTRCGLQGSKNSTDEGKVRFLFTFHMGLELFQPLEALGNMLQGSRVSAEGAKAAVDIEVEQLL